MKYWHPETQQKFRSKVEAQSVLKVLSPVLVEPTTADQPTITAAQRLVRNAAPTEVDGAWVYGWTVEDLTDEEARAKMAPLSRAQFAGALALSGAVTAAEARAWGKNGDLPSFAITAIENSSMTADEKLLATIKAESATEIDRTSPIVALLQAAKSLTDAQVDALFTTGAAL
jgi:hypothetical protein